MVLLAAVFTDTIDLKCVSSGQVAVFAANLLFQLADFLGKEFHGAATIGADHVVMAAAIVLVLVAGDAIMKGDFAGQSALREQLQRTVYRRISDAGIFFLHQAMKFVGGEMIASFQEGMQNGVALRGLFQTDVFQMAVKDFLSLADHLARDGGLIIDAFLQHGGAN
jgi:hypothetical protein